MIPERKWPRFPSHSKAHCFNCGGDLGPDPYWTKTGYSPGNGQFSIACEKCRMTTFYDLQSAKEVSPNLFLHHRCYKCRNGELPCTEPVPGNCGNPIALNH